MPLYRVYRAPGAGGRPTVLMIKILVLQQLYNPADDAVEYQLLERRSFLRFLDLTERISIPRRQDDLAVS